MEGKQEITGVWCPIHIWRDDKLSSTEKILWLELASFKKGVFLSDQQIADRIGVSDRSTVNRLLKKLVDKKYILILGATTRRHIIVNYDDPKKIEYVKQLVTKKSQCDENVTPCDENVTSANREACDENVTQSIKDNKEDNNQTFADYVDERFTSTNQPEPKKGSADSIYDDDVRTKRTLEELERIADIRNNIRSQPWYRPPKEELSYA
jgi:DNA-binding Lrp family transcriptional regulator